MGNIGGGGNRRNQKAVAGYHPLIMWGGHLNSFVELNNLLGHFSET